MISTVTLFLLSPTVNMVFRLYVIARDTIGAVALCACFVGNGCASVVFLVFSGSKMYFMLTFGVLPNHETRYKGTRLDGEKDFYETYFGGGTRGQNVMVSSGDEGNAATPLGLQAMQEVGCEKRPTYLRKTDLVQAAPTQASCDVAQRHWAVGGGGEGRTVIGPPSPSCRLVLVYTSNGDPPFQHLQAFLAPHAHLSFQLLCCLPLRV